VLYIWNVNWKSCPHHGMGLGINCELNMKLGLWKLHNSGFKHKRQEGYDGSWFFGRENGIRIYDAWECYDP
jgi:hypothetical protein